MRLHDKDNAAKATVNSDMMGRFQMNPEVEEKRTRMRGGEAERNQEMKKGDD